MSAGEYFGIIERYIDRLLRESSPAEPIWNIERVRKGAPPHWNYIDGCMLTALWELYIQTSDRKYADFADNLMDFYINEDGWPLGYKIEDYNLDNVCPGRVLFDLLEYSRREKYAKAIKLLFGQLEKQPRTYEGSFWHKAIYPNQVWLDGLFMAQVFYVRYSLQKGNNEYIADTLRQFETVKQRMYDEERGLFYHGYDASRAAFWADKETGRSRSFWLRAMGWFAVALADICGYLPDGAARETLSDLLQVMISGVMRYSDIETGMFYQVVDQGSRHGNYLETSGTSMLAYAMLKGARLGILGTEAREAGTKAFDGVCRKYLRESPEGLGHCPEITDPIHFAKRTQSLGNSGQHLNLGGICLVAGLGPESDRRRDGSFEYYISEPIVENDAKGVAPFLMSYTEMRRIQ